MKTWPHFIGMVPLKPTSRKAGTLKKKNLFWNGTKTTNNNCNIDRIKFTTGFRPIFPLPYLCFLILLDQGNLLVANSKEDFSS